MYSTCTFSQEENEGVITKFLEENPDFELEDSGVTFGRKSLEYARRIFPMDGGEGHFAARLRKSGKHYKTSVNQNFNQNLTPKQRNFTTVYLKIVRSARILLPQKIKL